MAQSWEWNPEASAMDTGFRLDELLRTQRAENARQAQQLGARAQEAQYTTEQGHQNRLAEMLYGQQLKDQAAQQEAERTAPFLQQLIKGNPQVGKAFGFVGEPQIERTGAMLEPEAMGTPAPIVQRPVAPTLAQTTGLARAVPGITQALIQKSMEPTAGFTLSPGQRRFDAQGNLIAEGGEQPGMMSQQQAEAIRDDMVARDPSLRGRVSVQSTEKGGWTVKQTPTEPLTESPSKWLADANNMSLPVPRRIEAQNLYNQWFENQKTLMQARENVKPLTTETSAALSKMNDAILGVMQLSAYTPQERETYTGAGRFGYEAASYAMEAGLPIEKFGYTPDQIRRYQEFKKNNGYIEQFKFALGGKQLTGPEQKVVEAFIPTGRERTTAEYEAKLRTISKLMQADQEVMMYLARTGKGFVDAATMHQLYVDAYKGAGIDVTNPKSQQEAVRDNMTSGQRLRQDFSK